MVSRRHRSSSARVFVCVTACAVSLLASRARADIDPAPGLEWLSAYDVVLENAADFPNHVFVTFPCFGEPVATSLNPYCVVREGDADPRWKLHLGGTLYAIPARHVKLSRDGETGLWRFDAPQITDEEAFFERDVRVVRPGFLVPSGPLSSAPEGVGIRHATYYLRVESVGRDGVVARFSRAKYRCASGAELELPWDPARAEPPVPICPPAEHLTLSPGLPGAPPRPPPDLRMVWFGVALASASLLLGGLLLRADGRRGSTAPRRADAEEPAPPAGTEG